MAEDTATTQVPPAADPQTGNGDVVTPPTKAEPSPPDECDRDFDRYERERPDVVKSELESEKNYDTLLVTLSTVALGTSLTVLKDVVGNDKAGQFWALGAAWVAFVVSLAAALYHRKLTYETHKKWREILDEEFTSWKSGAWTRAMEAYHRIPGIKAVDHMKNVAYWALIVGVVFLSVFLVLNLIEKGQVNAKPQPAAASPAVTGSAPTHANPATGRAHPTGTAPTGPTQTVTIAIGAPLPTPGTTQPSNVAGNAATAPSSAP